MLGIGQAFAQGALAQGSKPPLTPDQARRVVFMTGGAFSPEAQTFLNTVTNRSLEKPFKPKALREMVDSRLVA